MSDWTAFAAMLVVAGGIPVSLVALSRLLRPSVPETQKSKTYESGEQPTGDTDLRFNIQYYLLALMFLVFDVETVLIIPWTVTLADRPETFLPAFVFILLLLIGVGWAWRNGGIEWIKPHRVTEARATE
ncbi:MAG: NADH-quinone oxidoreductase subunit A [Methanobacteriota archaeon]|jgi:NADH-quinone oxidoreductase subunit A|uniref:NADH-quinone oxidoreductase subunit A n=1 Tax=Halorutilus salinus TaxID=2487751 RepID=A0A9Q4C326_9EURY|nr:NADH-quinone oxidoreductase subunit A [Halorutilus salinus]MCX2818952.1 NADH-quinone oxidoreductase subunit A [Halorutilus salinus]